MAEQDADLVRRTMAGDRAAFEALVGMHLPRARAVARAVLHEDAAVDDAVQESFLRAYQRLGQLGDPAGFPAWLAAIVRNEAITVLRRRRPAVPVEHAAGLAPVAADEDPRLAPLRAALAALPPRYREILLLKYEAGLDYPGIAEALGMSLANVEKTLYRARQALLRGMGGT